MNYQSNRAFAAQPERLSELLDSAVTVTATSGSGFRMKEQLGSGVGQVGFTFCLFPGQEEVGNF